MEETTYSLRPILDSDEGGTIEPLWAIVPSDGSDAFRIEQQDIAKIHQILGDYLAKGKHDDPIDEAEEELGSVWVTIKEALRYAQMIDFYASKPLPSIPTIKLALREGKLRMHPPLERTGAEWRFPRSRFLEWLRDWQEKNEMKMQNKILQYLSLPGVTRVTAEEAKSLCRISWKLAYRLLGRMVERGDLLACNWKEQIHHFVTSNYEDTLGGQFPANEVPKLPLRRDECRLLIFAVDNVLTEPHSLELYPSMKAWLWHHYEHKNLPHIAIATNQPDPALHDAGWGDTHSTYEDVEYRLHELIQQMPPGVQLNVCYATKASDGKVYLPDEVSLRAPQGDIKRCKPAPGMLFDAMQHFNNGIVSEKYVWMAGSKDEDEAAAMAAEVNFIRVKDGMPI